MFRIELFRNTSLADVEKDDSTFATKLEERKFGEGSEKIRSYELSDTQKKIINLLVGDKYLSATKIAKQLGLGSRSIEKILKNLETMATYSEVKKTNQ